MTRMEMTAHSAERTVHTAAVQRRKHRVRRMPLSTAYWYSEGADAGAPLPLRAARNSKATIADAALMGEGGCMAARHCEALRSTPRASLFSVATQTRCASLANLGRSGDSWLMDGNALGPRPVHGGWVVVGGPPCLPPPRRLGVCFRKSPMTLRRATLAVSSGNTTSATATIVGPCVGPWGRRSTLGSLPCDLRA